VDVEAVARRRVGGDRVAQRFRAPGNRVLIDVFENRVARGGLERLGRRKIREALRQIDRAMLVGKARHFADDRFGEACGFFRRAWTSHGSWSEPSPVWEGAASGPGLRYSSR